jgi:DNA-binding NarL/FixJ family response regulator
MDTPLLYDIVESPAHPDLSSLAGELDYRRLAFSSQRKAIAALKRQPPDLVVADFYYGYGNNYAGANVSNLDVLLRSLQRFAPAARVVVLADRSELQHVPKLAALFALHAVVALPASRADLETALR